MPAITPGWIALLSSVPVAPSTTYHIALEDGSGSIQTEANDYLLTEDVVVNLTTSVTVTVGASGRAASSSARIPASRSVLGVTARVATSRAADRSAVIAAGLAARGSGNKSLERTAKATVGASATASTSAAPRDTSVWSVGGAIAQVPIGAIHVALEDGSGSLLTEVGDYVLTENSQQQFTDRSAVAGRGVAGVTARASRSGGGSVFVAAAPLGATGRVTCVKGLNPSVRAGVGATGISAESRAAAVITRAVGTTLALTVGVKGVGPAAAAVVGATARSQVNLLAEPVTVLTPIGATAQATVTGHESQGLAIRATVGAAARAAQLVITASPATITYHERTRRSAHTITFRER